MAAVAIYEDTSPNYHIGSPAAAKTEVLEIASLIMHTIQKTLASSFPEVAARAVENRSGMNSAEETTARATWMEKVATRARIAACPYARCKSSLVIRPLK